MTLESAKIICDSSILLEFDLPEIENPSDDKRQSVATGIKGTDART